MSFRFHVYYIVEFFLDLFYFVFCLNSSLFYRIFKFSHLIVKIGLAFGWKFIKNFQLWNHSFIFLDRVSCNLIIFWFEYNIWISFKSLSALPNFNMWRTFGIKILKIYAYTIDINNPFWGASSEQSICWSCY